MGPETNETKALQVMFNLFENLRHSVLHPLQQNKNTIFTLCFQSFFSTMVPETHSGFG